MSQPYNRLAEIPAPGPVDRSLREFWATNPWQIAARGHNLSCYERNRAYLNVGGKAFLDISHLTGADSDGDGRGVVAADFRNVGMQDLIVRQAGGGALLLFENRLPRKNYLAVTLRGRRSNRQGIGARLTAVVKGRPQVREVYPANGFHGQAPTRVHFGLAGAGGVESLTIRWPSGEVQVLKDIKGGRHVVVEEGRGEVETVVPGRAVAP